MKKSSGMAVAILTVCVLLPLGCKSRTSASAKIINVDTDVTETSAKSIDMDTDVTVVDSSLSGFSRFSRSYTSKTSSGLQMSFRFVVDFPDSSITHRNEICDWIVGEIEGMNRGDGSSARYKGSHTDAAGFGDFAANDYFETMRSQYDFDSTEVFSPIGRVVDWRARVYNDRYVTYLDYLYDDLGGAHGLFWERPLTYDLLKRRVVTNDVLISPGCEDKVVDLIYDALVSDSYYRKNHDYPNADEGVKETVEKDFGTGGQAVGLTDEGVVFSFQPYEVGCFADGCYHVTVPYDKLRPYLRPEVLTTILINRK